MMGKLPEGGTPEGNQVPGGAQRSSWRDLLHRFQRDESGNYVLIGALLMPVLVGMAAWGTEEGMLVHKQKVMQHAADSAAVTAAVAVAGGANDNGAASGKAIAANYGFVGSSSGPSASNTTVAVNSPPTSGPFLSNRGAIEVVISQPQSRVFSSIWGSTAYSVTARAVATPQGQPCILALNQTASASYSEQ